MDMKYPMAQVMNEHKHTNTVERIKEFSAKFPRVYQI